jgi:hypothetical protein
MSNTVTLAQGEVDVHVNRDLDAVGLAAHDPDAWTRGEVHLWLTPGQAVQLSRALVKAAAEALGTKV